MKVKWKNGMKTYDISEYVESVEWEGSDTQTSRKATISVIYDYYNKVTVNIKMGDILYLNEGGEIFAGVITNTAGIGGIGAISYTAKDFMHYLIRSKGSYNFKKMSPEKIAKKICNDLLIQTTSIYQTKTYIKSLLFEGETYYNMIVKAYNQASTKMNATYPPAFMPIMKKTKLSVIIKGKPSGITLTGKNDLTNSEYTENTEDMVTRVHITDENGKIKGTVENTNNIKKYGVYQEIYKKEKDTNSKKAAKQILKGTTKGASVESVGYLQCMAGYSVKIEDKASKLKGTYYIENDKHTWKDGVHTMELTLKFSNEMEDTA